MNETSKMVLRNYNGQYQLLIKTAEALEQTVQLPDTCWVATSAPVDGLRTEPVFLEFLDSDVDGRIRVDEVRNAVSWALKMLSERKRLEEGSDSLRLADIATSHDEGKRLHVAAKQILKNLGEEQAEEITLAQVRDLQKIRASSDTNGDGVITSDAIQDTEVADYIKDLIDTVGSVEDASGQQGISEEQLAKFKSEAEAYLAWDAQGQIPEDVEHTEVMVWGSETGPASDTVESIRPKIDEYFQQCMFVSLDERAVTQMQLAEKDLTELNYSDQAALEERAKALPLATPCPDVNLDLNGRINPYYREIIEKLKSAVLERVFDGELESITRQQWQEVGSLFSPYLNWIQGKKGESVEKLGIAKLQSHLESAAPEEIRKLIEKDKAVADELAEVSNVERLILYQKCLLQLAKNFVSFPYLYDPDTSSLFQMGQLIMNGTIFSFNIEVKNRAPHKDLAKHSQIYVMYVECTRQGSDEKFEVATPITAGDSRDMHKGRRGIFITTDGKVWDAEVVDFISNPVSLWEAIKAPFLQLGQFIEKLADKFSTSRYTEMEKGLSKGIDSVEKTVQKGVQEATTTTAPAAQAATTAQASRSGAMRDIMVGGSVAVAALGSALAFITKSLSQVKWWQLPIGVLVAVLVLIVPLIILGVIKLRRRNLGPILEASGWAINAKLKIGGSMGFLLTRRGEFPKDAIRDRKDMVKSIAKGLGYQSKLVRILLLIFVAILCFFVGSLLSTPAHNLIRDLIGLRQ